MPTNGEMFVYPGQDHRALENPNIPLGDPVVWNQVFGDYSTSAGEMVGASRALTLAPVYQAVSLISGDVAKIPLNIYKRRADLGERGREVDREHPAQFLVRWQANHQMTAYRFWRRMMVHALIWGNAYALIDRDPFGNPLEMIPLLPDRTAPRIMPNGDVIYVTEINGELLNFPASSILHLENISIAGDADCELIFKARETFAQALAANKFASKFFANGARIGGILEVPLGMSKQASDTLEQGFRKTYEGVDNSFKTVLLRDGAKFHQAQFTPEQSQMVPVRKELVKEIARFFNLPPHKLGDDSKSSYNSLEQENRSYLDSSLSIWLNTIASEVWLKLLTTDEQKGQTHFAEHNVGAFIQADIKTQYEVGQIGINNGIVSPNEVRAFLGLNPRDDGLGDKFMQPLNMANSDDLDADDDSDDQVEYDEQVESDDEQVESDDERQMRDLLNKAIDAAITRVIAQVKTRCKKAKANRFCSWIDEQMFTDTLPGFQQRFDDELKLYCSISSRDYADLHHSLVDSFYSGLNRNLNDILQSVQPDQLRGSVDSILEQYKAEAITTAKDLI